MAWVTVHADSMVAHTLGDAFDAKREKCHLLEPASKQRKYNRTASPDIVGVVTEHICAQCECLCCLCVCRDEDCDRMDLLQQDVERQEETSTVEIQIVIEWIGCKRIWTDRRGQLDG
jgi:hypothetical protein